MRTVCICALALTSCIDFGYELIDAGGEADLGEQPNPGEDAGEVDGASGCVEGSAEPSANGPQLRYASLAVDQRMITVHPGDVVTWTNGDTMRHSVVAGAPGAELPADRGGFNSGELAPGGQFAFRFCRPRTLTYFCATHPSQMNNYKVVVE